MCRCGKETVRVSSTLLFTLSYPDSTGNSRASTLSWVGLCYPWFSQLEHTCSQELPQLQGCVSNQPSSWLQKDNVWGLTFWLVVARKTPEVWLSSAGQGLCVGEVTLFSFLPPEKPAKDYEFAQILKRSICLEQNTQAWCENCEKYQPTVSLAGGTGTRGCGTGA